MALREFFDYLLRTGETKIALEDLTSAMSAYLAGHPLAVMPRDLESAVDMVREAVAGLPIWWQDGFIYLRNPPRRTRTTRDGADHLAALMRGLRLPPSSYGYGSDNEEGAAALYNY